MNGTIPLRWHWRGGLLLVLCALTNLAAPASPSLQNLVAQLGSDNSQLRDDARAQLMALPREDLPRLRAAALAQTPLLPGQIEELRDVVTQVYLAGEPYKNDPANPRGFLGLYWPERQQLLQPGMVPPSDDVVTIDVRIPGFPAYRVLQTGDIITGIVERPQVQLTGNDCTAQFIQTISLYHHGDTVHLNILRSGHPATVALTLAPVPLDLSGPGAPLIDNWIARRTQLAEDYWKRQFSVLDPGSPSTQQQTTAAQP